MLCDRCCRPITVSANHDQPLCASCARHLRTGGAWPLGSTTPEAGRPAPCPLEYLHLRAAVLYGEVPLYPIRDDFDLAVSVVERTPEDRAAHWHVEAVRWRRGPGYGAPLDLAIIAGRVAARLWKQAERHMREAAAS